MARKRSPAPRLLGADKVSGTLQEPFLGPLPNWQRKGDRPRTKLYNKAEFGSGSVPFSLPEARGTGRHDGLLRDYLVPAGLAAEGAK